LLARIGSDEGNMKTPSQQFHLGLGPVIPVAGLPRPRISRCRIPGNDDDAPQLPVGGTSDAEALIIRPGEWGNFKSLLVHEEVVTDKVIMPGALAAVERRRRLVGRVDGAD